MRQCWGELPRHVQGVSLDAFALMPNHVHGIVFLADAGDVGAGHDRAGHDPPLHLGTAIGLFKSASAREINRLRGTPGRPVWQRGYFDRVVRSEAELRALREYVAENPLRWALDRDHPSRRGGS
ncbi:MAG: transposase [Thermoleophilia bacterium]|nr:transposase [Thermoleophilia bacterium]